MPPRRSRRRRPRHHPRRCPHRRPPRLLRPPPWLASPAAFPRREPHRRQRCKKVLHLLPRRCRRCLVVGALLARRLPRLGGRGADGRRCHRAFVRSISSATPRSAAVHVVAALAASASSHAIGSSPSSSLVAPLCSGESFSHCAPSSPPPCAHVRLLAGRCCRPRSPRCAPAAAARAWAPSPLVLPCSGQRVLAAPQCRLFSPCSRFNTPNHREAGPHADSRPYYPLRHGFMYKGLLHSSFAQLRWGVPSATRTLRRSRVVEAEPRLLF